MFGIAIAGPYVWGLLPHIIILCLLIDIYTQRISKFFLIIPFFMYGSYYTVYVLEGTKALLAQEVLKENNPVAIVKYKSSEYSLVLQDGGSLGQAYKIPITYESNENVPQGYFSYRIVSEAGCESIKGLRLDSFDVYTQHFWYSEDDNIYNSHMSKICQIRSVEAPQNKILKVIRDDGNYNDKKNGAMHITYFRFFINDKLSGVFKSLTISRLPWFPFLIGGCGLNSGAASWDCFFQFYRSSKTLDTFPKATKANKEVNPIAVMLGLEKFSEKDFYNFQGYEDNENYINQLLIASNKVNPEDFNKWGIRKDSMYMPKIGKKSGIDSFEGFVDSGDKGGEFYDFIKSREGRIVYLEIETNSNPRDNSFTNYGVCKARKNCTGRTDDTYRFGDLYHSSEQGKFRGVFFVGKSEPNNIENPDDHDTVTNLQFIRYNP